MCLAISLNPTSNAIFIMKKMLTLAVLLAGAIFLQAQINTQPTAAELADTAWWNTPRSYPPQVSYGQLLGSIPPLRDLTPLAPALADHRPGKLWHKRNYFKDNELNNPHPLPQGGDPLASPAEERSASSGPQITPLLSFAGMSADVFPPDPTGDIGKNHYVQMTNTGNGAQFRIWNKQGVSVYGPAATSTIWSQVNSGSAGDPIIQYDPDAERWLMLELQGFGANELVLAISDTDDPTGSWKAYRFQTFGFPDYPKLYVWPDAYFLTLNEISGGNLCSGYALEKAALLAGAQEFKFYRFQMPNHLSIQFQPATGGDWEGGPPPPPGSPGYIFRVYDDAWNGGADQLQVWEVHVDWQDSTQSHLDGPQVLYPAPFETKVCWTSMFDCIEQPDANAPRLEALENIIMYRAPYRNFGDHESVVLNHVADVSGQTGQGGDAQFRWYELRKTGGGPWQIHQQGTHAPDLETNRFMGTISIDQDGNIGAGYSVCSDHVFPGLRLSGRRVSDPINSLPIEEYTLKAGATSHTATNRWGDYSSLAVDPEDGRTFWFTGEYQPQNGLWGTWIGSFRIQRDTFDVTPETLTAPQPSALLGNAETVTVEVLNGGLEPAFGIAVTLRFEGATIVTDLLPDTLFPGQKIPHTFSQTVDMPQVGKNYAFEIITDWPADGFAGNDTLRVSVKKLTSDDAAMAGKTNLPGLVCGSEQTVGLVLRNASGLPLQSAEIHWRLNLQAFQVYSWTGNLAPGERDTVYVTLSGITNGLNGLRAISKLPNGQPDQDISNDTLTVKFLGNLDGTYLTVEGETEFGVLHWELRTQTNQILLSAELPAGVSTTQVCSDDGTCYQLVLRSTTLAWQGEFRLLDIFGNLLAEIYYASPEEVVLAFCTPERQQVDVGALQLLNPVSSANLSAAEPVQIAIRNFGLTEQSNLEVAYRLDGGPWNTEILAGPLPAGATATHTFSTTEDLSTLGEDYLFELRATTPGDEAPGNDTVMAVVWNRAPRDLAVQNLRITQGCSDPTTVYAVASLFNNGLAEVSDFQLNIAVNGQPQTTQDGLLTIASGASADFFFPVTGSGFGLNTLAVDLTGVNAAGEDFFPANDTASVQFALSTDGLAYAFLLVADEKPGETRWELSDAQGNLLRSGGPYGTPFQIETDAWCLQPGACYTFRLLDAGGDGMSGSVSIADPSGNLVWALPSNDFGAEISVTFCADNSAAHEPAAGRIVSVTPNPTAALLQVSLPARPGERTAICDVFDSHGRFLQTARLSRWDDTLHGVVSLETYATGVYFLKIRGLEQPYLARVVKTAN